MQGKSEEIKVIKRLVGFTASSFDLLHAGHVMMLKESRERCDHLVVGLNINPIKDGQYPVQSVVERYAQLQAIRWVDEIVPYMQEKDLIDLIKLYGVSIRFIGEDYRGKSFTGDDLEDIEIFYNKRNHRFSSSELKHRVRGSDSLIILRPAV